MSHLMELVKSYIDIALDSNPVFGKVHNSESLKKDYENKRENIIKKYDKKQCEDSEKFNRCYNKLEETTKLILNDIKQHIK